MCELDTKGRITIGVYKCSDLLGNSKERVRFERVQVKSM